MESRVGEISDGEPEYFWLRSLERPRVRRTPTHTHILSQYAVVEGRIY